MKITAVLQEKMPIQKFGEEGSQIEKQTCIFVETFPEVEYPNSLAIDFSGENLILAGAMTVGKEYEVNYSTKAKRVADDRVFNTVRGWKIKEVGEHVAKEEDADDLPL